MVRAEAHRRTRDGNKILTPIQSRCFFGQIMQNGYGATALCILSGKLGAMMGVSEKIVQSQFLDFGGCTCSYQRVLAGCTSLFRRYKRGEFETALVRRYYTRRKMRRCSSNQRNATTCLAVSVLVSVNESNIPGSEHIIAMTPSKG